MKAAPRVALIATTCLGAAGVIWFLATRAGGPGAGPTDPAALSGADLAGADLETRLRVFCSSCHLFPPPDSTPRRKWRSEVTRMFALAGQGPPLGIEETVAWYEARAPEELPWFPSVASGGIGPLPPLRGHQYRPSPQSPPTPAVASVEIVRLFDDEPASILICEMRHGAVMLQRINDTGRPFSLLARVPHPAHARVVDLDGDGLRDLVISDLGSFDPADHHRGRVIWARQVSGKRFEVSVLLEGVGRVSEVDAGDLDGDGDLDLAVAIFGWRTTGNVTVLENVGAPGTPRFQPRLVDVRPGAVQARITDLDGDSRPDLAVLFAQHFETVVGLVNRGGLSFRPVTIGPPRHPNWGYSNMEVVDLDGDGDQDLLVVNGDALDDGVPKAYHGLSWLENRGAFPFEDRRLVSMPGAHRVRAGDFDGDGDLDLFVSAFIPHFPVEEVRKPLRTDAILWLEQVESGVFEPRALESIWSDHPALDAGDFDGDGDVDVVAGNFLLDPDRQTPIPYWVTLYESLVSVE